MRSEERRAAALSEYFKSIGLTHAEYEELQRRADRPWYRVDNDDDRSAIIIPRHQLSGMIQEAATKAPAGCRFDQNAVRSEVQVSDLVTDRTEEDAIFSRYVLLKDGKGKVLSSERKLQENPVLTDCLATGIVTFDPSNTTDEKVRGLLEYALRVVGVGASRKLGYGRGRLVLFQTTEELLGTSAVEV